MTLEQRLENWARTQRAGGGGESRSGSGLTASIYFAQERVAGRTVDYTLDQADADRVQRAIRLIMPLDRELLRMHFVFRAPPPVICRRLKLRVRPVRGTRYTQQMESVFALALVHAKRAIRDRLADADRQYVSMQGVLDALRESGACVDGTGRLDFASQFDSGASTE